jgi:hypothetical protein
VCVVCFFLKNKQKNRVSLWSLGWPQTPDPPASASRMLGLQVCTAMSGDICCVKDTKESKFKMCYSLETALYLRLLISTTESIQVAVTEVLRD